MNFKINFKTIQNINSDALFKILFILKTNEIKYDKHIIEFIKNISIPF